MAIVVETLVPQGSKAQADELHTGIERGIMQLGGPPAGLMAHFVRPSGDGFLICDVWRSEAEMRSFYDDVVLPELTRGGLESNDPFIAPAWSFARP